MLYFLFFHNSSCHDNIKETVRVTSSEPLYLFAKIAITNNDFSIQEEGTERHNCLKFDLDSSTVKPIKLLNMKTTFKQSVVYLLLNSKII